MATVGTYTGIVEAKSEGSAVITATSLDGDYTDSCEITVIKESVTIMADGNYNKVVFNRSGKVWYCMNIDTIYIEENALNSLYTSRANLNYYINPNLPYRVVDGINNIKTYSDDEIKLLYAIDPYGVARYVQMYADQDENGYNTLEDKLKYKDNIFKLIYGRNPLYFARSSVDEWYALVNINRTGSAVSESETLFGMHTIYDGVTLLEIAGFVIDIACIVFGTPFFEKGSAMAKVWNVCKTSVRVLSAG